jgi:hypothetical protein
MLFIYLKEQYCRFVVRTYKYEYADDEKYEPLNSAKVWYGILRVID